MSDPTREPIAEGSPAGHRHERLHRTGLCAKVDFTGWEPGPEDAPTIYVARHHCDQPNALDLLFLFAQSVTLTLQAPATGEARAKPGRHPRLDLHLNPGPDYNHQWCVLVDLCGVCTASLFEPLLTAGQGRLARRLTAAELPTVQAHATAAVVPEPDRPRDLRTLFPGFLDHDTLYRPFTLVRRDQSLDALKTIAARSRIPEEELTLDGLDNP